jgi:membrane protein
MNFLESVLPPTTSDFFNDTIFKNLEDSNEKVGLISSVFLLSILLMANGVNALFSGFENSYHEQLTRNVFRQYLYALGVAIILAFLLILIVAGLGYFQIYVLDYLNNHHYLGSRQLSFWEKAAQYAFFVIMIYIATSTLYYFGTKEGRFSRFLSIGSLFTTLLIILTSYFFGIYIENFANYNELYGSIGALLILLFYLWLNSNILLLGFELNMSLSYLKKRK